MSEFKSIIEKIRKFRDERDWLKYHDHKSMAVSVVLEASELLEHFQWKNKGEIEEYAKKHKDELGEEIADVCVYIFELADNLGIDLEKAIKEKIDKNAKKYPVDKIKGNYKKYNKI